MKINLLTACIALGAAFMLLTSSMRDPNNPPVGKTGAPSETTCAQSSCHSGGAYTGTVTISGVPDTVLYGHTYSITVKNTSNAVRAGFELTCLDSLNAKCGTLTSASGVSIGNGSGRQYARQSTPKNLSGGAASWTFNWTAPAAAAGKKATFYFVSLCANSNGQKSGDNVLTSNKPIVFTQVSPVTEPLAADNVKIYPTQVTDVLHIDLQQASQGKIFIFNTEGQLVVEQVLTETNTLDISHLKAGSYVAKVQTSAGASARKFVKF